MISTWPPDLQGREGRKELETGVHTANVQCSGNLIKTLGRTGRASWLAKASVCLKGDIHWFPGEKALKLCVWDPPRLHTTCIFFCMLTMVLSWVLWLILVSYWTPLACSWLIWHRVNLVVDHTLQLGVYINSVWLTHFIFEHFKYIIPQPQASIVSAEKSDVNLIEMPLNVTNLVFFLFSRFFLLSFTIFTMICLFVNLSVFILLEVHWISWVVYVILHLLFVLRIISRSFNGCFLIILTGFTREWVSSTHHHSTGWPPLPSSCVVLQTRTIFPCLALMRLSNSSHLQSHRESFKRSKKKAFTQKFMKMLYSTCRNSKTVS